MNLPDEQWLKHTFPDLRDFAPLGQGGQKIVYVATHKTDGKIVLKIIHPRTALETVRREILAVQQVQSPRVPRIMEDGKCSSDLGDCIWLREQLIVGNTVRELLAAGPLDSRSVLRLGLHVLEALDKTETAKIVHRDVKPENIMRDTTGGFWLLDYGIARHLELSSLTATGLPFGKMTLGYAPPEQCRNMKSDIDSRADLFALGVTLHECAVGKNGFFDPPPRDQLELLRRVERWVLPPVALQIADGDSFQDLVRSLTQKSRIHRPRTIKAALAWLQEICAKEGIS
jgi:eukaryotic-like serine/threonine-protein kinase